MTANAGYHAFSTGDVLTAAQVQYNLQNQTIMYFASSAARTTALSGVLVEGMFSYLADTNSTEYYDGAAWQSISNPGDITAVTAGTGITGGGTSGAVTITNDMATTITTAGDLIKGTGSGTYARLGIGSTGQVLTVSGGAPSWATPSGGGGMTLINTGGTAVSGLTTVTISSIPATYKYLKILCIGIKRGSVGGAVLGLQLNGDTSAQYLYGQTKFSNTTAGSTSSTSTTSYEICAEVASSNGGASEALLANIDIYGYANTSYSKLIVSQATAHQNNWINQNGNGFYVVATAITSISIISSQTMGDGTVYVYGVS